MESAIAGDETNKFREPTGLPPADNEAQLESLFEKIEVDSVRFEIPVPTAAPIPDEERASTSLAVQPELMEYNQLLSREPQDPTWAPGTEATIDSVLASVGIPYDDVETTCRSTICRATINHGFSAPSDGSPPPWNFDQYGTSLDSLIRQEPRLNGLVLRTHAASGFDPADADQPNTLVTTIFLFSSPP